MMAAQSTPSLRAQPPAASEVWVAEEVRPNPSSGNQTVLMSPLGFQADGEGRPIVLWAESHRSGGPGTGWWARREGGVWRSVQLAGAAPAGIFSAFDPVGGAALGVSSNGVPYVFHPAANFASAAPFYLVRIPLMTAPEGPGSPFVGLPGTPGVPITFDVDGRASESFDFVTFRSGERPMLNGVTPLTGANRLLGNAAKVVFRQGPRREPHVLYQTDDGWIRYNGGSPESDRPLLLGNTGSMAYSMAIDGANGIHVAAAAGSGRFFFGAVGRVSYLHSKDGATWETNAPPSAPEDVGATAIALDSKQRPAMVYTRAFQALYFTRLEGTAWTPPVQVRTGLGGWDHSRNLRLMFDADDVPRIAVSDRTTGRLLVLSAAKEPVPTDVAVTGWAASTNRAAIGSNVTVTVTVTNAGPRDAATARLRVRLPDEWVVRDVVPRPGQATGSEYWFELGTLQSLEARAVTWTVTALEPSLGRVEAEITTTTSDPEPGNNALAAVPVTFLSPPCLAFPAPAGCAGFGLGPDAAPPALAGQPWSQVFRAPLAPPGSELRISPGTPLPPEFCLTSDGELRGLPSEPGSMPLVLDLVMPGGATASFTRDLRVAPNAPIDGLVAFWPLDGHGADSVGGTAAALGARGVFVSGAVGSAFQAARDALVDPNPVWSRPDPLLRSTDGFGEAVFGKGPATVAAWVRIDPGVAGRGRRTGAVVGLVDDQADPQSRYLAFDPATSRLNVLAGHPDARANVLAGPVLAPGAWHHVALVNDGLDARFYTNGVLAVAGRFPRALATRYRVLAGSAANGGEFSGAVDEVALFRRALTPSDLAALTGAPLPRRVPLAPGATFPIASRMRELVLPDAPEGEAYEATLEHAFCGVPGGFRLVQGALPVGVSLSEAGRIAGVSVVAGESRFRVRATDAGGATADLDVRITTRPGLPVFVQQPVDQRVEAGGLLLLTAETRGKAALQWYYNDRPLPGETGEALAIPEFSAGLAGRYRVRASNPAGATWSREVRVGLATVPEKPPTVDVAPVELRPDGRVRVRVATLRGRVYELQRALDLGAALAGGWRTVSRFVATETFGSFEDLIPGRPGAAFYRVIEILAPPAVPFSIDDGRRFLGIAADGRVRPGLLPSVDPASGRLGAFEFHAGAGEAGLDQGLVLRFPQGAQPVDRDGGTMLRFRQGELFFGEGSPVQLDENGANRIALNSAADLELPSGPLSVEVLERLLGKPRGSGVGLVFFRHFRFDLVAGEFDGGRIRNAQLAWADRPGPRLPTPERTGRYVDFDIELSSTRLRLPFHGEFALEDGSSSPARVRVSPRRPVWVELRPGPEIALSGRGTVTFAGGPEFEIDFSYDDPVFRAALGARRLRLPEGLTLRGWLGRIPLPEPPGPVPSGDARQLASVGEEYLKVVQGRARDVARKSCAASAAARVLLGEVAEKPEDVRMPGLERSEDELVQADFTEEALAELRAWGCVAEAYGGVERAPEAAYVLSLVERHVASSVTDASPIVPRGADIGPMTYAYRAAVLGEVAHLATLYPPEMSDVSLINIMVTDPRYSQSVNLPNPRMQPLVDRAYEAFMALQDIDPAKLDTPTLLVAGRGIQKALAAGDRNSAVISAVRVRDLWSAYERVTRARAAVLQRELGIETGQFRAADDSRVGKMHRWEAMAYLRQALRINEAALLAGSPGTAPVASEVLAQLASRAWTQLRDQITAVTNGCTALGYYTVLGAAEEIAAIALASERLELEGRGVDLPTGRDIMGYTLDMERACAAAQPPVTIENLYVRANPDRIDEGRVLPVLGRLKLLERLPASIREPTPEVVAALDGVRRGLDALFQPASAPPIERFEGRLVLWTLRAGLRHDELRRRFRLPAEADWLGKWLPALQRMVPRRLSNAGMAEYNRLLALAAWRPKPNPLRNRGASASASGLMSRTATAEEVVPPDDLVRRRAYLIAALEGVAAEEAAALALGREAGIDDVVNDVVAHLADVRLPGGLTVEEAHGELTFDTRQRRIGGSFRGRLQLPGAGLRLTLNRADFDSGGAFSGELFGSLALPPARPVATLSIPSMQPARLSVARRRPPTLSGGGQLRLSNGATVDCFLSLEDPVYRFSASARGLRLELTRAAVERWGLPLASQLDAGSASAAIEYVTRAGLMVEGAQPPAPEPAGLGSLRRADVRPQASDVDDLAAGVAALELLTRTGTLDVPPVAGMTEAGPAADPALHGDGGGAAGATASLPPAALVNARELLRHLTARLGRANAAMASDTIVLGEQAEAMALDAPEAPASERAALRRAKVLDTARRLADVGRQVSGAIGHLTTERGRELLGAATEKAEWETELSGYLRNFRDALVAARDRLVVPATSPAPGRSAWVPGPDWDRVAATNLWAAAQRYEATVQGLGVTDAAWLAVGQEVGCAVFPVLIEAWLESLGLDPVSGAGPSSGGALAVHLGLSRDEARRGFEDLLQLEGWQQAWPVCSAGREQRVIQGIAAMALRARELAAQELLSERDRIRATTRRPWEEPEFLQAAAARLLAVLNLPERLGLTQYPEATFALVPQRVGEEIREVRRDVADVFALLNEAWTRLADLIGDESSGYPAELRRRKATPLPEAGPVARLLARYADVPAVAAARGPLGRVALFEAELLQVQSAQPAWATQVGREAAGWVRRLLNAARLLDAPSGRAVLSGRQAGNGTALQGLIGTVLPRLEPVLRGGADVPWWTSVEVARELHEASRLTWQAPGTAAAWSARSVAAYDAGRARVGALAATRVAPGISDLSLPGEIEITRLFGSVVLNRETRYVQFEVGGRLEFPNVRTVDGRGAFLELQRLRLESTGRFAFAAATRGPLPFADASFAGGFRASGDLPRRALSMSGEGTLTFLTAPKDPVTGQTFPVQLTAGASYEPVGYDAEGRPVGWRFAFRAGGAFRQSFGKDFAVFAAGAGLIAGRSAEGQPTGGVSVGGSVGLFRKADRRQVEPPAPADFHVLVENAGIEIVGTVGEGGHAAVTNGTVKLPAFFYPTDVPRELACENPGAPRVGTSVSIQSPIRVRYAAGDKPRLEGTLRFSHFGVRLGGTNAVPAAAADASDRPAGTGSVTLTVCQADLGVDAEGRPFLDIPRAGLGFEIPSWDRGLLRLQNVHLGLDGRTQGELFLVEDFDLVRAGGLRVAVLGAPAYADPAVRPPLGCRGTGIDLDDVPGFDEPRVTLSGGVRVQFPVDVVANLDGSVAGGFFCGGIRVEPTADGPRVSAFVDELGLNGDLRFGRSGFRLQRARIGAGNFESILAPDPERPFFVSVSGDLQAGPFVFGLSNARIQYRGLDMPPAFGLDAVRFARDATRELPVPFSLLPASIEFAELAFERSSAPLAEMLAPQNLRVTASFRVGLPTIQTPFLGGGVSGVVFRFREDGSPIPPPIDGFDLTLSATAGLQLPAFGDLGGKVRIGGLRRAIEDPTRLKPEHIYAVGQLGATQQGYRLAVLGAFNLAGPIGLCLDVNFGGAGIVLSPTPFQITGASGGVALLSTENPCDFAQYFDFDPATGTYQIKQTVELPQIPVGMPWEQFVGTLQQMADRIQAFADRFHPGTSPVLAGAGPADDGTLANFTDAGTPAVASDAASRPVPSAMAGTGSGMGAGGSAFPSDTFAAFACPGDCPPRTVAILCQPHPDTNRFPNRVIFKYSSIPESVLTQAPPLGLGLDPAAVRALGGDHARLGGLVANRLVALLENRVSPGASLPPEVRAFLLEQERLAMVGLRIAASNAVAMVVRGAPDAYAAVRDELYRGIGCPDLSLSLAGRMSMVGLSSFGWLEGRETSAFSGSGGVVGQLYALGVPLGEARAFISTTDAQGLPNPSACGQITASFGPLDMGKVDLALRCENCVTEFLRLFPRILRAAGPTFVRAMLERVAPDWIGSVDDPESVLARWQVEPEAVRQRLAFGFLSGLAEADPVLLAGNLAASLRPALAEAWDRIQPQLVLCGEITPRLLGLPLTGGGRSVGLHFLGEKARVIGEFGFTPYALVPIFPPGDEASLSFAFRQSDPLTLLLRGLDGSLSRSEGRAAFVREQVEDVLQNLVLAANYQWHPFGLELGDAAMRILMPDVLDHPALPGSTWQNPDERGSEGLPSRDEVLVQAAASGKLGQAFDWLGTSSDFADIFAADDPRRAIARQHGLDLRRTYFPHGGIVGGARMALPRLLMVAPGEWQPLHEKAVHGTNLFEQLDAALTLLNEYVLRTETNGTAAFYTPAPNPPLLYDAAGRPLGADQVRARIVSQPDDFSPEGLVRQLRGLDLGQPATAAHLYPDHFAFLRAELTNLTVLGVPVFGTARLTGRPSPMRLVDGAPLARLEVDVAGDSAVGKVAGGGFTFGFDIHATPEQSLVAWAKPLVEALQRQRAGGGVPALAAVPDAPQGGLGPLERLASGLARQLPRFAATNALPALSVVNLREWAAGGAPVVLGDTGLGGVGGDGFGSRSPKGGGGSAAPASPPVLRAELELHAYSPLYDPAAPGDGPVVEARRGGGLAARGTLEILPESPGRSGTAAAELGITLAGNQPRLRGRLTAVNLPTPFGGVSLQNAHAEFDSQATTFLRAFTTIPGFGLGSLFRLESTVPNQPLSATVTLSQSLPGGGAGGLGGGFSGFLQTYSSRMGLELAPARLSSDRLGGALLLHGAGSPTNPVVIGESGWSARASFVASPGAPALHGAGSGGSLTWRADLGGTRREIVRVSGLPTAAFRVQGTSPTAFAASFDASLGDGVTVEIFPGASVPGLPNPVLRVGAPVGESFRLEFGSDGTFLVEGALTTPYGAGAPGLFASGARVRIDPTGATVSGAIGASSGTLQAGWFDGRLEARFSGQLSFPPISLLGGRFVLSGPDGGNLVGTTGPDGTCVSGALLTLREFSSGDPLRLAFPRFCLGADGTFSDLDPTSPAAPGQHAVGAPELTIGAFVLGPLTSLKLSGNPGTGTARLDFQARLRLGTILDVPIRGSVGAGGLRFVEAAPATRLLGFDFTNLRLGATNALGDLPDIGFTGRLLALPAGLGNLDLAGRIPGAGAFRLAPALPVDVAGVIPSFPLRQVQPTFQYRPEPYGAVARAGRPSGYWPLDETTGEMLDQRLARFGTATRRSGVVGGGLLRGEPGAFGAGGGASARFDGSTAFVGFPSEALAPTGAGFSASLWFRRGSAQAGATPQTLVARGTQWSLVLREPGPGTGRRLALTVAGLTPHDGPGAAPLVGRTPIADTAWHHVVAVFDGGALYLYLDGRLEAWRPVAGSVEPQSSVATSLGARPSGRSVLDAFDGWIDEVALYPEALRPVDVLAHWLAGGRPGLALDGRLVGDVLPGLTERGVAGLLGPGGEAVVSVEDGGRVVLPGLRLQGLRATLLRGGGADAAIFEAALALPLLDDGELGTARGVFDGAGSFTARATALADRGVFGWDLRLTNLVASGEWRQRAVAARVGARLTLPHRIAALAVGGDLDLRQGRYSLTGTAGGAFGFGSGLPFSYTAAPKLTEQQFELPGRIALGNQADAASFATQLVCRRDGQVAASFVGLTDWTSFLGVGHGRLDWSGSLAYTNGAPRVTFRGQLGLSTPQHPVAIADLPEGVGVAVSRDPRIIASLRNPQKPIDVSPQGLATAIADPPFQGQSLFHFDLKR